MSKSVLSAVVFAFLVAAPAFASVQHFYCHSPEEYSAYQVAGVVVDDTHLDQVYVITSGANGEPITTQVGAVTGTVGPYFTSFALLNETLRLPTDLTQRDYKAVPGSLLITDEAFPLACFTNTSL
jgi:hypothetical protein